MQKFKKYGAVALAAGLATMLAFASARKQPLDDSYFGNKESVLFVPAYTDKQPNKIIVEATQKVREWTKANGFDKEITDQMTYAESAAKKVHSEKNLPFGETAKKYGAYLKNLQKEAVSPEDFLNLDAPMCMEKSVFLAAVLREKGIDSQIFIIQNKEEHYEGYFQHVFVVAKVGNEKIFLDPFYGFIEKSLSKYKAEYLKQTELEGKEMRIFPLIKYKPSYDKYMKNEESERKLDESLRFKLLKRRID